MWHVAFEELNIYRIICLKILKIAMPFYHCTIASMVVIHQMSENRNIRRSRVQSTSFVHQGRIQDLIRGAPQIVTGLKLPFWGLSFVEFWCWGLIFGGRGGGPGPPGPPLDPPLVHVRLKFCSDISVKYSVFHYLSAAFWYGSGGWNYRAQLVILT